MIVQTHGNIVYLSNRGKRNPVPSQLLKQMQDVNFSGEATNTTQNEVQQQSGEGLMRKRNNTHKKLNRFINLKL